MTERNEKMIQEVVDALKGFVIRTEASVATTRNHYGDYMGVIMAANTTEERRAVAQALILCGADKQGVGDALRLAT